MKKKKAVFSSSIVKQIKPKPIKFTSRPTQAENPLVTTLEDVEALRAYLRRKKELEENYFPKTNLTFP